VMPTFGYYIKYSTIGREWRKMGREIRRVPLGWCHPVDERGHYVPMHDRPYESAIAEWTDGLVAFNRGDEILPDGTERKVVTEYGGWADWEPMPTPDVYRPAFTSEPTCYQIYETVSEGTPVSPVFETKDEMIVWLVNQGHSWKAAEKFTELGFAFSLTIVTGGDGNRVVASDIEGLNLLP